MTTVKRRVPRTSTIRRFLHPFAFFFLFHTMGWSQQSGKDLSGASLEELSNIQVYSASKRMQRTSEAPSSVTVMMKDEIQKYGYCTLADVLRSVRVALNLDGINSLQTLSGIQPDSARAHPWISYRPLRQLVQPAR